MIKQIINKLLFILAVLGLFGAFTFASPAAAQTKDELCRGLNITQGSGGKSCAQPEGSPSVEGVVRRVIQVLTIIIGIVAVIMIIIAGLKYITSGGDANSISSAKNTLLYAVVGLIIVAMAQVIVRFVLNETTG